MKQSQSFFYGDGQSLVRISDRGYQPVDVSTVLKKPVLVTPLSKSVRLQFKFIIYSVAGFLVGGLLGELAGWGLISAGELAFLKVLVWPLEAMSISGFLSGILSAGLIGALIGFIIAGLSLIEVPE